MLVELEEIISVIEQEIEIKERKKNKQFIKDTLGEIEVSIFFDLQIAVLKNLLIKLRDKIER